MTSLIQSGSSSTCFSTSYFKRPFAVAVECGSKIPYMDKVLHHGMKITFNVRNTELPKIKNIVGLAKSCSAIVAPAYAANLVGRAIINGSLEHLYEMGPYGTVATALLFTTAAYTYLKG